MKYQSLFTLPILVVSVFGGALLGTPASAKKMAPLPDELVLTGDNIITVTISGRDVRLEVRPESAQAPMLNPDIAKAMALKTGMFGFTARIGPDRVSGVSAVLKANYGAKAEKQRIFWADRASSNISDGTINPASLPYKRVKFLLAKPAFGEIITNLPLDNFGFLGREGMGTTVAIGDKKMKVQFALIRSENLVSAPTGNWIADHNGGQLSGPAKSTLIAFFISRPTRSMSLTQPITVGDAALNAIDVRVRDYGDTSGISEAKTDASTSADDGDTSEIVVMGKKEKDVDLKLVLGRDYLRGCSSLTYDLDKRRILISCKR
jgi:hypothetical protein